jgi:hypothetical protein
MCKGEGTPYQNNALPLTTFVAKTTDELEVRGDFLVVNDVARIFSRWDQLKPVGNPNGFERYADDSLKQIIKQCTTKRFAPLQRHLRPNKHRAVACDASTPHPHGLS